MFIQIPQLISIIIFISGLLNIVSAFWIKSLSRFPYAQNLFLIIAGHFSRTVALLFGVFLLFIARGLWQQKKRSWFLALIILILSFLVHLTGTLNFLTAVLLLIPIILLIFYRKLFFVESGKISLFQSFGATLIILAGLFIYAFFGFFAMPQDFTRPVTYQNIEKDYLYSIFGIGRNTLIPVTKRAQRFEDSISVVGFLGLVLAFAALFSPLLDREKPSEEEIELALFLDNRYSKNSVSPLCLMDDKTYFFARDRKSFIAYKVGNGVAVVLGDPVGQPSSQTSVISEFISEMKKRGLSYAFYSINQDNQSVYLDHKMKLIKVGEEAVISTADFNLDLPEMKDIRYGFNKMDREGLSFIWFRLNEIPWQIIREVDDLHQAWVSSKKGPALSFSLDYYPLPPSPSDYLLVVKDTSEKTIGAFSFFAYDRGKAMVLELMLRSETAPNGMVDAAIAHAVFYFKNRGVKHVSLSTAPLSNIEAEKNDFLDRAVKFIFDNVNQFYGYKSLFEFKAKFKPVWQHKYLAYQPREIVKTFTGIVEVNFKDPNLLHHFFNKKVTE